MEKLRGIAKINKCKLEIKGAALLAILSTGSTSVGARRSMDGAVFVRPTPPGGRCPFSAMT